MHKKSKKRGHKRQYRTREDIQTKKDKENDVTEKKRKKMNKKKKKKRNVTYKQTMGTSKLGFDFDEASLNLVKLMNV